MTIKLANNASGTLATSINASDTGAVLTTGDGAKFPTLAANQYFYATLESIANTLEIVKVTARSGDSITIVRAQESTIANSFAAGSRFELRVTAQSILDAIQDADIVAVISHNGDGTTTAFAVTNDFAAIYINGVYQNRSTYTVTSGAVTFSTAPPNTSTIEVVYN